MSARCKVNQLCQMEHLIPVLYNKFRIILLMNGKIPIKRNGSIQRQLIERSAHIHIHIHIHTNTWTYTRTHATTHPYIHANYEQASWEVFPLKHALSFRQSEKTGVLPLDILTRSLLSVLSCLIFQLLRFSDLIVLTSDRDWCCRVYSRTIIVWVVIAYCNPPTAARKAEHPSICSTHQANNSNRWAVREWEKIMLWCTRNRWRSILLSVPGK